jgi:hypothetical protein
LPRTARLLSGEPLDPATTRRARRALAIRACVPIVEERLRTPSSRPPVVLLVARLRRRRGPRTHRSRGGGYLTHRVGPWSRGCSPRDGVAVPRAFLWPLRGAGYGFPVTMNCATRCSASSSSSRVAFTLSPYASPPVPTNTTYALFRSGSCSRKVFAGEEIARPWERGPGSPCRTPRAPRRTGRSWSWTQGTGSV